MPTIDTTSDPVNPEEAIDYFRRKVPLTEDQWGALVNQNNDWAFRMAGIADIDVVEDAYSALDEALATGSTLEDFKGAIGDRLEQAWGGTVENPGWRIETIFRTNLMSSYSAGRYAQQKESKADRPYLMLDVVEDDATSEICQDADEQVGGQAIPFDEYPPDLIPPLHHNCRSQTISLTEEDAIAMGILTEVPEVEVAEGFENAPGDGGEPDPEDYPSDLSGAVENFL